jgi:hypothetical protein
MYILMLTVLPSSIASPSDQYTAFNDGTVKFDYPSWKPFPGEAIAQVKRQTGAELQKYKRYILDLQMFISPKEEAVFFISKTSADNPPAAQDLFTERQNVHRDALKAGYLTKVNALEILKSSVGSMVVEDVDRNDGQRARTVKIVVFSFIYEVTLAVSQKSNYEKYRPYLDHAVDTFKRVK